jgi:uncharacterized protein
MDSAALARFMNRRQLELILLPTEQCNFRCTYCYEDFEIGQMKENTVEAIKKLVLSRLPTLQQFVISWFGGEPLMAKNLVYELNTFAQRACHEAGVEFRSNMTTNGFGLDKRTFDRLVELGVRHYQVSLDGDEEQHDKTRKLQSGRGSFRKIWANLLQMRSSSEQFSVQLRLHIHQDNVDSIKVLLEKIATEFGTDSRFAIYLKTVGNWGGETVKSMALIRESGQVISELERELVRLDWFAHRGGTPAAPGLSPCYAARPNSFVIRADGALAKCTVAFSDPRNRIGHINDDGSLFIENEKMRNFMRGFQSLEEEELQCPMHGMPELEEFKVIKFEKPVPAARAAQGVQPVRASS